MRLPEDEVLLPDRDNRPWAGLLPGLRPSGGWFGGGAIDVRRVIMFEFKALRSIVRWPGRRFLLLVSSWVLQQPAYLLFCCLITDG